MTSITPEASPSPRALETATALLPCKWRHHGPDAMEPIGHHEHCPVFYRPAIAQALQVEYDRVAERDAEIERLRGLFEDAMDHVRRPEYAHVNDRTEIERLRRARAALEQGDAAAQAFLDRLSSVADGEVGTCDHAHQVCALCDPALNPNPQPGGE